VGGPSVSAQPVVGGIELPATAKEARERMKKKADKKQQASSLSLQAKYELLQNL